MERCPVFPIAASLVKIACNPMCVHSHTLEERPVLPLLYLAVLCECHRVYSCSTSIRLLLNVVPIGKQLAAASNYLNKEQNPEMLLSILLCYSIAHNMFPVVRVKYPISKKCSDTFCPPLHLWYTVRLSEITLWG